MKQETYFLRSTNGAVNSDSGLTTTAGKCIPTTMKKGIVCSLLGAYGVRHVEKSNQAKLTSCPLLYRELTEKMGQIGLATHGWNPVASTVAPSFQTIPFTLCCQRWRAIRSLKWNGELFTSVVAKVVYSGLVSMPHGRS